MAQKAKAISSTKSASPTKEARESRLWLGMIKAVILPEATEVADLHAECDEIVRILFAILRKARSTRTSSRH